MEEEGGLSVGLYLSWRLARGPRAKTVGGGGVGLVCGVWGGGLCLVGGLEGGG